MAKAEHRKKVPELLDFVDKRDWTGALGLLKFQLNMEETLQDGSLITEKIFWMAYCYMHIGAFHEAVEKLDEHLHHDPEPEPAVWLWKAVCKFGLGLFKEAEECAFRGPTGQLQNRILFHIAHRLGDEAQLINYHQRLTNSVEDQLSLAGMHFLRGHYQEATDLYKRVLLEQVSSLFGLFALALILVLCLACGQLMCKLNDSFVFSCAIPHQRENLALNIYVALCYYKLDYYDVSLEILSLYLRSSEWQYAPIPIC